MSDLYLDTWSDLFAPAIARAIVAGRFTLAEGEAMLRWEVRPAFYINLLLVAGEWTGWDEAIVRSRVLRARSSRWPRLLLGRDRLFPREEWARVAAEVVRLQAASATASVSAIQPPPRTRSPA